MRKILLDTSAFSAYMRGHTGIKQAVQRADQIVLTPIVLGELEAGFRQGRKLEANRRLLEEFLAASRVKVAMVDEETAERYGRIVSHLAASGQPLPTNDIWIAASAMQHGLYVVTTDAHFAHVPQVAVDLHAL